MTKASAYSGGSTACSSTTASFGASDSSTWLGLERLLDLEEVVAARGVAEAADEVRALVVPAVAALQVETALGKHVGVLQVVALAGTLLRVRARGSVLSAQCSVLSAQAQAQAQGDACTWSCMKSGLTMHSSLCSRAVQLVPWSKCAKMRRAGTVSNQSSKKSNTRRILATSLRRHVWLGGCRVWSASLAMGGEHGTGCAVSECIVRELPAARPSDGHTLTRDADTRAPNAGALDHAARRLVAALAAALAAAVAAAPLAAALAALAEAVVAELGRHVAHGRLGVARELRLLMLAQLDGRL
eukprot:scaffold51541_cov63-Phaeocystis_antarctica.AAC.1